NQSKMDPVEHLRQKALKIEKNNLELNNQHKQEISLCEKEVMKLRLNFKRGEVLRQGLESEMSLSKKASDIQMYSAEDELCDVK
ncbi:CC171 protein, partial [Loxia curvirostra]|nr:CC171 protein [Loxia curvirostra]NXG99833.1 CC171 protein [Loxia leucoptera]